MGSTSGTLARPLTEEEKKARELRNAALIVLGAEMGIAALSVLKDRQAEKLNAATAAVEQKTKSQNTIRGVER